MQNSCGEFCGALMPAATLWHLLTAAHAAPKQIIIAISYISEYNVYEEDVKAFGKQSLNVNTILTILYDTCIIMRVISRSGEVTRYMSEKKENPFYPYELQFNVQERKEIVAEMMRELRKAKGYSQKYISEMLGISPQTYTGYERGRNEPPIETLVRISYLYNMPIDILVQRDRKHKTNESAMISLMKMDEEMALAREQLKSSPLAENEQVNQFMGILSSLPTL